MYPIPELTLKFPAVRFTLWLAVVPALPAGPLGAGEPPAPRVLDPRLELVLFAKEPEIVTPIGIDVAADGSVWVIESHTHFRPKGYTGPETDRVLVFEDLDGDGRPERKRVWAEGFHQAMALRLLSTGDVLLATRRAVHRILKSDAGGPAERRMLVRLETPGDYPHNGLSGFAEDELGRVYFALGENLGEPYRLIGADGRSYAGHGEGGSIFRIGRDGTGLTAWATGFWNTFHLATGPYGELFAVDNDPDSRPPCRLLHIVRGGDYGYRFWLGRKGLHPFTAWNGELPGTLPMITGTGEAPSGMLLYEHTAFPDGYRGTFLVTSWGDHRIERYTLAPEGATFRAERSVVVQGDADFRPVGIAQGPRGEVYFTDWVKEDYHLHGKGRIWVLRSRKRAAEFDRTPAADPEAALGHPVRGIRRKAILTLTRAPDGAERARRLLSLRDPQAAYGALVVLARRGELKPRDVERIEGGAEARIAAAGIRLLADVSPPQEKPEIAAWLRRRAADPRAPVRREAVLALGYPGGPAGLLLQTAAQDPDLFVRSAATASLAVAAGVKTLRNLAAATDPRARLAVLLALKRKGEAGRSTSPLSQRAFRPDATLLEPFLRDESPEVRLVAIEWAAEARVSGIRPSLERALTAGPVLPELVDHYLAALEILGGGNPAERDRRGRDDALLKVALDETRPLPLRRRALQSISVPSPVWSVDVLRKLLRERDPLFRREAVRSAALSGLEGASELLSAIAADPKEPLEVRREAVLGLAREPERHRVLLERLSASPEGPLAREARRALNSTRSLATSSEPPANGGESPPSPELAGRLLEGGDPQEGEYVFFHPHRARCIQCHTIGGRGGRIGPDLSLAGRMGRERIVLSILDPARDVAPAYRPWVFITVSGVRTGVLLEEEAGGAVLLGTADGKILRIEAREILERREGEGSIMPRGLERLMSEEELRDLVAFLASRK